MGNSFEAVKITDDVYWVGAIDWAIRDFHGYHTGRGSTYNAYLILADKVTLMDTVKSPFFEEMMGRIRSVIDPAKIDYLISNHSEMDHSGSIRQTIATIQPEQVFASPMGAKALVEHFHLSQEITPVKDGETLSLGNRTLTFLETRMLHWPDSMVSYLAEEQLLFSQDGFGMHLATSERFADEIPSDILEFEGAKYYANILLPYSALVLKLAKRIEELGLRFSIIAPDHGPIWRKNPEKIIGLYVRWAEQKPGNRAVVAFDSMWGSTELMARSVADGLAGEGTKTKVLNLRASHRSDLPTEVLGAGALLVGSPTLNNGIFPTLADNLCYLKGLKPQNLIGGAFGSYGWSGESVKQLEALLKEMGVDVACDGLRIKYVPDQKALAQSREWGAAVARQLKGRLGI
ncbi:MAG TPA: FprA family A-type flavoprotein [bacterium]|nr:FprA family A-type flavoprotein [bacterium]